MKESQHIDTDIIDSSIKSLLRPYIQPLIAILICISALILVAFLLSSNVDGYQEGKKTLPARKYDHYPGQPYW